MSLIVAESGDNQNPAFFRNNYKDGIQLKAGSEVSLVSLSFNKDPTYNIVTGSNDTFRWIIGETPDHLLHDIVVPAGTYSGGELATELERLLDESTVLRQYVWSVTYDPDAFNGQGSFTIGYTQQEAPENPTPNTFEQQSGTGLLDFDGNGTVSVIVEGNRGTNDIIDDAPITASDNIAVAQRGLFSNGGIVDFLLTRTDSYTKQSFDALDQGTINIQWNQSGSLSTWTWAITSGAPQTAGWNHVMEVSAGGLYRYLYYFPDDEGVIKMSYVQATSTYSGSATDPANWEYEFLYNDTQQDLRDSTAGDRTTAQPINVGSVISRWDGAQVVPMGLAKFFLGYGANKFGYARNQIYQNDTIEPQQTDGFDTMLLIEDNAGKTDVLFSLSQMIIDAGGNRGGQWVFQDKTPSTLSTIITDPTPTNWTDFTYGQDNIGVRIEIDGALISEVSIYHDDNGDLSEQELTMIAKSGVVGSGYSANIKEVMYPLRPCMSIGSGGRYEGKIIQTDGFYDDDVYSHGQTDDFTQPSGLVGGLPDEEPAQFVMGALNATQIGTGDDQVHPDDAPVPLDKYNINKTLGMKTLYIFPEGKQDNAFSSDQAVALSIREEALLVEITDFGIVGFNGGTGDTLKIVAVCPREELSTNTQNGTVNYYAKFPIFVDLNLINDQKVYDLNIALRNLKGELVSDILPNTVATFLVREKDEIKQKRLMREQTEMLMGMRASQNQSAISQIGRMM